VEASDLSRTAALLGEVFPGSRIADRVYLDWLYTRSPFGQVIETNYDDERGRAGHYALVPITLVRDGVDLRGALSLNTAVHERARGGGMFVRLANETIAAAGQQGVSAIVGVANASSTPGFVRRLGFELLTPLPATVILPTPGPGGGIRSGAPGAEAFSSSGLAAGSERLLAAPALGLARAWTPETLRWRLEQPGARYVLHRAEDLLAVSCADSRHGVRVAILLKVFAASSLAPGRLRALVRAACRSHRAPVVLHVGLNDLARFRGVPLPERLRESPLNLIYRGLESSRGSSQTKVVRFEFLDFDAY
jgi:hypothetical protein